MEGLFVYMFILIIAIVVLLKWNLGNIEKIEQLKKSNEELLEANFKLTNKKNGK